MQIAIYKDSFRTSHPINAHTRFLGNDLLIPFAICTSHHHQLFDLRQNNAMNKSIIPVITMTSAIFASSCSNKASLSISDDETLEEGNTPEKRLELKKKLGYNKRGSYTITADVYRDHRYKQQCIVYTSDTTCGEWLGYSYCIPIYGELPDPSTLDNVIIPHEMTKTLNKFVHKDFCSKPIPENPVDYLNALAIFDPSKYKTTVLESKSLISNLSVLNDGISSSDYYSSSSCFKKVDYAFIDEYEYWSKLSNFRFYKDLNRYGSTYYYIDDTPSTFYKRSGYDCIPQKGFKLVHVSRAKNSDGYTSNDLSNLNEKITLYCKSMCKSYDNEGTMNHWQRVPLPYGNPISLSGIPDTPF